VCRAFLTSRRPVLIHRLCLTDLVVISGGQGGGKTTVAAELFRLYSEKKKNPVVIPPIEFMRCGGYYDLYPKSGSERKNMKDEILKAAKEKTYGVIIVVYSFRTMGSREQFLHPNGLFARLGFKAPVEYWCESNRYLSLLNGMYALHKLVENGNKLENEFGYGVVCNQNNPLPTPSDISRV
jgi:hypothetical protein